MTSYQDTGNNVAASTRTKKVKLEGRGWNTQRMTPNEAKAVAESLIAGANLIDPESSAEKWVEGVAAREKAAAERREEDERQLQADREVLDAALYVHQIEDGTSFVLTITSSYGDGRWDSPLRRNGVICGTAPDGSTIILGGLTYHVEVMSAFTDLAVGNTVRLTFGSRTSQAGNRIIVLTVEDATPAEAMTS